MQSKVLDEFALEAILFSFEECETARHWKLLSICPISVHLTNIFRVSLAYLFAQRDNTPRIQISIIPISDHHSEIANLSTNDVFSIKTSRIRLIYIILRRSLLACNLRIYILLRFLFEEIFLANAHQHHTR